MTSLADRITNVICSGRYFPSSEAWLKLRAGEKLLSTNNFFAELKRRNVYKVAATYAIISWLLIQVGSILFPTFEAPGWVMKTFIVLVALGFPLALIFAWAYELTPTGVRRTEYLPPNETRTRSAGRKFNLIIIALLFLAVALLVFDLVRHRKADSVDRGWREKHRGAPVRKSQ